MLIGYKEDKKANYIKKLLKKNRTEHSIKSNCLIFSENSNYVINYFFNSKNKSILITDKNIQNDIENNKKDLFIIDLNNININEYDLKEDIFSFYFSEFEKFKNCKYLVIYYNSKINNHQILNDYYYSQIISNIILKLVEVWKSNENNKLNVFIDSFSLNLNNKLLSNGSQLFLSLQLIYSYKYSELNKFSKEKLFNENYNNLYNINDYVKYLIYFDYKHIIKYENLTKENILFFNNEIISNMEDDILLFYKEENIFTNLKINLGEQK